MNLKQEDKDKKIIHPHWTQQRFECKTIQREISATPLWDNTTHMDIKIIEEDGKK